MAVAGVVGVGLDIVRRTIGDRSIGHRRIGPTRRRQRITNGPRKIEDCVFDEVVEAVIASAFVDGVADEVVKAVVLTQSSMAWLTK